MDPFSLVSLRFAKIAANCPTTSLRIRRTAEVHRCKSMEGATPRISDREVQKQDAHPGCPLARRSLFHSVCGAEAANRNADRTSSRSYARWVGRSGRSNLVPTSTRSYPAPRRDSLHAHCPLPCSTGGNDNEQT